MPFGIDLTLRSAVIALSLLVSAVLAVRVWRSRDPVLLKATLTLILLVPVIGPVVVYWISNFPDPAHPSLRDQNRYSADMHGRWSHVLRMTDPVKRFQEWRRVRDSYEADQK